MIQDHKVFQQPAGNVPLWRYMDLAKFLSMLHTSSLWFARADKMEDTYEAAFPTKRVVSERELLEYFGVTSSDYPGLGREEFFLSCWYMSQHESAAMWKLYCGQGDGIAICSTLKQLKSALAASPFTIFAGKVHYIDYETEDFVIGGGNAFAPILHKRKSFEHEREMRLVISGAEEHVRLHPDEYPKGRHITDVIDTKRFPVGYSVPVKLSDMVSLVMVAPTAPAWYKDVVEASLKKFGYPDIPAKQSPLYSKPLV